VLNQNIKDNRNPLPSLPEESIHYLVDDTPEKSRRNSQYPSKAPSVYNNDVVSNNPEPSNYSFVPDRVKPIPSKFGGYTPSTVPDIVVAAP
jgi:hypothetical protein